MVFCIGQSKAAQLLVVGKKLVRQRADLLNIARFKAEEEFLLAFPRDGAGGMVLTEVIFRRDIRQLLLSQSRGRFITGVLQLGEGTAACADSEQRRISLLFREG